LSLVIHDGNARTRASEVVALGAIAWVIAGIAAARKRPEQTGGWKIVQEVGRWLLAITLIIFGVQHFMYAAFVATLIPAWIPGHLFFTYLTGAGMVATGISIATKVYARLAGILLGSMFLFWVVFLHAPRVMALIESDEPYKEFSVTEVMKALEIGRPEAQNALKNLYENGQLYRARKGKGFRYWLPVEGAPKPSFGGESQN